MYSAIASGAQGMDSLTLYILLVIPAFIFSLVAQGMVKSAYRKMSQV